MSYWNSFRPYIPVYERKARAYLKMAKRLGKGVAAQPIKAFRGNKMAKTFWGMAWSKNLESYSDYQNRLPRGRTYARNGSILHLDIGPGKVSAFVAGSDLYEVKIVIEPLADQAWQTFKQRCAGRIDTLLALLRGRLTNSVIQEITHRKTGLFPAPSDIRLNCSCPDWAKMCKHIAATLYGVGVCLDTKPELFFKLRGVDHQELLESASAESLDDGLPEGDDVIAESDLSAVFGIEISDIPAEAPPKAKKMRAKGRSQRR